MSPCVVEVSVGEWWINNSGYNLLKGVEGDATNRIHLDDGVIIDFLRRIPASRSSFNRLVPNMLEDEQIRLRGLIAAADLIAVDPKVVEDAFQASQNKIGVHATGRFGGTRRGGNS